jgi:hypothetical protein
MPTIALSKFFNFVFGDLAKPLAKSAAAPAAEQRALREKIENDKKREQLNFITKNPTLSAEFRIMLRDQGNKDLENLLYDNTTDVLNRTANSGRYTIPSDDEIKEQFEKINQEYGYFTTDKESFDNFVKLFKTSKLMADFVEENNSTDNSVAYLHAYKMMVLFGAKSDNPFKSIEKFMSTHAGVVEKPIHDCLVLPIPKNAPPLKYLEEWQKLIGKSGRSVVPLFQQAPEIESILDAKKPVEFTIETIKEAACQIAYKNYARNPELAKLCLQYRVNEENFNKCLDIKVKTSDNLPQVTVDGTVVGRRGYHLVKLPIDDPRAGILGQITNCCQSIGGHSEKCVIDGMTRENNGFYVLLRTKTGGPKSQTPPRPTRDDGQINYNDFEIVGQGYAWLSESNNLTLDSWENRTPDPDDSVIQDMLPQFSKQIFEQKPDIGRVTIGTGGKTPAVYKTAVDKAIHPELMAEGHHYGDSSIQVVIALNPAARERGAAINEKLRELNLDVAVDISSFKQAQWFDELLNMDTFARHQSTLGAGVYERLLKIAATGPDVLEMLFYLNQEKLLTKEVADLLLTLDGLKSSSVVRSLRCLTHAEPSLCTLESVKRLLEPSVGVNDSECIRVQLTSLSKRGLLTEKNINLVLSNREYAADVARILNKREVSERDLQLLIENPEYASKIWDGLSSLEKINCTLLTDQNVSLLAQNPQHIASLVEGLAFLYKANPVLMTAEHSTMLNQYAGHAASIGIGLATLYNASPDLMTAENRAFITQDEKNSSSISGGLVNLYKASPALVTAENRTLLTQHAEHARVLGSGMAIMYKTNPDLLADEKNITLLEQHAQYACYFGGILVELNKAEPSLLTDENRTLLAEHEHPESADLMNRILIISHKANPALITQDYFHLLMKLSNHQKYCFLNSLQNFSYKPSGKNYQFISDENLKFCAQNPEAADKFSEGLALLSSQVAPAVITDEIRGLFLKYADSSIDLANTIIELHKVNPELINGSNCKFIIDSNNRSDLTKTLALLNETCPGFIKPDNLKLLAQQIKPRYFFELLIQLKTADRRLITEENLNLVAQYNGKYISKILEDFEEMTEEEPDKSPKAIFDEAVANAKKSDTKATGGVASTPAEQKASTLADKAQPTRTQDLKSDDSDHYNEPNNLDHQNFKI